MASDSTAGDAPADMPVETSDPNDNASAKPQDAAADVRQLQAEKAELQDKLLRALAETQNVRRRGQQDAERERKFGIERFAKDVLSGACNLGRALAALPDHAARVIRGRRTVLGGAHPPDGECQWVGGPHGVKGIGSLGNLSSPGFHRGRVEAENPPVPAGTVVQELIPGYL